MFYIGLFVFQAYHVNNFAHKLLLIFTEPTSLSQPFKIIDVTLVYPVTDFLVNQIYPGCSYLCLVPVVILDHPGDVIHPAIPVLYVLSVSISTNACERKGVPERRLDTLPKCFPPIRFSHVPSTVDLGCLPYHISIAISVWL